MAKCPNCLRCASCTFSEKLLVIASLPPPCRYTPCTIQFFTFIIQGTFGWRLLQLTCQEKGLSMALKCSLFFGLSFCNPTLWSCFLNLTATFPICEGFPKLSWCHKVVFISWSEFQLFLGQITFDFLYTWALIMWQAETTMKCNSAYITNQIILPCRQTKLYRKLYVTSVWNEHLLPWAQNIYDMRAAEVVGEQDLVIHSGHYEIQSKNGRLTFTAQSRHSSLLWNVSFHSRVHMCSG